MNAAPLPDLSVHDTLPKLLELNARNHPEEVWLREKDLGIWNSFTWRHVAERVRRMALGLEMLGVKRGDVVALIGDNRPEWLMGEIAAHAAGAMSLGIYRDALADEVAYLVTYAEVAVLFAEDEEQVDKLLQLEDRIPTVRHIVYADPRGLRKYEDPRLISLAALEEKGAARYGADPARYGAMVAAGKGTDVAILCTTSGTTSHPKLAMLTSGALLNHCAAYLAVDPRGPDDEYVSVLQMPWIMEQIYAFGQALISRMKVNFVEEPETTMADMREIGPSFVLFAPRVWEQIAADVRARMMDASAFKRVMFEFGMKLGLRALDEGRRSWLADVILFRALRDRLGFTRLKSAATGGAALGPDTFRFFLALGVPMRQLYGQTELLGAYTIHTAQDVDFDTVGVPMAGGGTAHRRPGPERAGRDRHPPSQRLPRLLPQRGGDAEILRCGRMDEDRRCRLPQPEGPSGGHRPRARHGRDRPGRPLLAAIYREQAEILALCGGGGDPRRRARPSGGHHLHPLPHRRQMGREKPPRLHHLYRPLGQARGHRAAEARSGAGEPDAGGEAAHHQVPAALQGAGRGTTASSPAPERCGAASSTSATAPSSTPCIAAIPGSTWTPPSPSRTAPSSASRPCWTW